MMRNLTLAERKAIADAAARRLAQEAERKACAEALRKWRAPFVLTRNLLGKFRAQ